MNTQRASEGPAGDTVPRYAIGADVLMPSDPGCTAALAAAYAQQLRPQCLCGGMEPNGPPMYLARRQGGYLVKRMPGTGHLHAPHCASYEVPPELGGRSELDAAVREDIANGCLIVKLDFPLTRQPGLLPPTPGGGTGDVRSSGRLSLRGLLHLLWQQAELHRWHPGFAGKRTWGLVRRHLLQAAGTTRVGGQSLAERLYIPEVFSVADKEALAWRRRQQWSHALPCAGVQPLLLVLAEMKHLAPCRHGHQLVLKHMPEELLWLDAGMAKALERRFEAELAAWGADDGLHLVLLATAVLSAAGKPSVQALTLMLTTATWLPALGVSQLPLLQRLVQDSRRFTTLLGADDRESGTWPTAVLTDTAAPPTPLYVDSEMDAEDPTEDRGVWRWSPSQGALPPLPPRAPVPARPLPTPPGRHSIGGSPGSTLEADSRPAPDVSAP
ncbi:DUF1173 domain-containing protein [Aquincola tertiaricarbonis]|uniref:DUF1173 domain-containing protein n=1 Tax=Aquincola tertiaricarbonis TaxID=391953 RepID=A0ABY4S8Q2_AQUTE|nr:DUF1173 family protein [Aquincola tertiaricarbonis]URI07634.1 DUF1173 domain-containing protein [Aquincola tertiaricarbonis]